MSMSLYEDVLKEYYTQPLIDQLNAMIEYRYGPPTPASWYSERGLPLPWVYVPPPWHRRTCTRVKVNLRYKRESLGRWIGGIEEHDWYDD